MSNQSLPNKYDVKSIIAKLLSNDKAVNATFMTKPDDDLQESLFDEVKEMDMSLEDICID